MSIEVPPKIIQAIKRSAKSNWGVNELMQNEINDEVDAYQKFYGHEFGTASKHKESIIELALEEQTWQDKLAVLREEKRSLWAAFKTLLTGPE